MALVTTCPQCTTSFKVRPDQLKRKRGLVRCGRCQNVFSGIAHLNYVDQPAPGITLSPNASELRTAFFLPTIGGDFPNELSEATLEQTVHLQTQPQSFLTRHTHLDPETTVSVDSPHSSLPHTTADGATPLLPREISSPPQGRTLPTRLTIGNFGDTPLPLPVSLQKGHSWPHTDTKTSEKSLSRRRLLRFGQWLTGLTLLILLTAQLAILQRTSIVAALPETAPIFAVLLGPLGLPPPAHKSLSSLSISAFELLPHAPGQLHVAGMLLNHSKYPVTWPSIELLLKNSEGDLLERWILSPSQYLPPSKRLQAIPPTSEWPLQVEISTKKTPVSFSAQLFYP